MDRLVFIPDRDSDRLNGGDRACTFKHRLIHFNPCKGLALLLNIDYGMICHPRSIRLLNESKL
jgi:hypothetical protein